MHRLHIPLVILAALAPAIAAAQESEPAEQPARPGLTSMRMTQTVVLPLADGDDQAAKQDEALRAFYEKVSRTCPNVLATIAETCEITSITFNMRAGAQSLRAENQRDSIQINGDLRVLVRLKAEVGPPSIENSNPRDVIRPRY